MDGEMLKDVTTRERVMANGKRRMIYVYMYSKHFNIRRSLFRSRRRK